VVFILTPTLKFEEIVRNHDQNGNFIRLLSMALQQDFTIRNGLGIRVRDQRTCQAIRLQRGVWKEIGSVYELPLSERDLQWSPGGVPGSVIAVALRAYELDHPDAHLRDLLLYGVPQMQYASAAR
jgi:hypothetical protein